MNQYRRILLPVLLGTCVAVLGACNSVSTKSSSAGSPSGTPSGAPAGSSPSPSPSSSPASQSGQTMGGQSQTPAGMPQPGATQGTQQAGADGGQQGAQAGRDGQSGAAKTDDEILAAALGEFDRDMKAAQQGKANEPPPSTPATASQGDGTGERTAGERTDGLNKELDERFAKFDDLMRGERNAVADKNNADGAGGFGAGDVFDDGEGDGDSMQTAMINDAPPPMPAGSKGGEGLPRTSNLPTEGARPPPADVGNGVGDDVIARQLREAAMKEKDPELQAKLWEEYRKYKGGASQAKR